MINKAGKTVEPTVEAFQAAAASADWAGAAKNDFYVLFLDSARRRQPGRSPPPPSCWCTRTRRIQAATADALKFFQWGFEKGDQLALGLDYVPLPDNAVKAIEASWKGIQGSGM